MVVDYKKMYYRVSSMACIGVWEYDLVRRELTWSDAVYDLFEITRGTPVERDEIARCYSAASRSEMERLRSHAIETGGSFSIDIEFRTHRGSPRWAHLTADVEQENGVSVRIFGTKQDITVRKKAQEQVRILQSELMQTSARNGMTSMAATLAHELNQPLAAIANYAVGLAQIFKPIQIPEAVTSGLQGLEANALRAGEIIRRMRTMLSRGQTCTEAFDIEKVLREAVLFGCGHVEGVAFEFQFDHTSDVVGDPTLASQVAVTIIRNACEALVGAETQEVSICTHDQEAFVVVAITDNGPGLPETLQLFEPTTSSKEGGMGVGLSICRTIIEANGGQIWRGHPRTGASICFSMPKADPPVAAQTPSDYH